MRLARSMPATLAVAALLAGCGSSGSSTTSSGPTKAQFIAAADKLCTAFNAKLTPITAKVSSALDATPPDLQGGASELDQVQTIVRSGIDRLRALPMPSADRARIAQMLAAVDRETAEIGTFADGLRSSNGTTVRVVGSQIKDNAARYKSIAQSYGFKQCGAHINPSS